MSRCGIDGDHLKLTQCWTPDEVADALAATKEQGFDIALIDTRALPKQAQLQALHHSDLILSPAISPVEADHAIQGISDYLGEAKNVLGMIPGCRSGIKMAHAIRAAFGDIPMLRLELPWSEAICDQIIHGDIGHFVSTLSCNPDQLGYGRFKEAQAAWFAVLAMTIEVEWALQGLRLKQHVPHSDLLSISEQV
jgi:hypothetical protein